VHVVGAVIVRDGLVFAARRSAGRSAGGLWEFPGGKVEPGEDPEEALLRELREELAVDVTVGELVTRAETRVGRHLVDLACYWVRLLGAEPRTSTDHQALAWLAPEDLDGLDWSPADVPVVAAVRAALDPPRD
jgi:8-oxo-dGTP diphosphatase